MEGKRGRGYMDRLLFLSKGDEVKLRVLHAVGRPIDELTVEALCRKAGISKPTFYRHFDSKYDLARWASDFMCSITLDQIGRSLTWDEGLESYFALGLSELEPLRNVRSDAAEYERCCAYRAQRRFATIAETLALPGVTVDETMRSIIEGHVRMELHFSEERLDPTRTRDVKEIVSIFKSFIPAALYNALATPLDPQ